MVCNQHKTAQIDTYDDDFVRSVVILLGLFLLWMRAHDKGRKLLATVILDPRSNNVRIKFICLYFAGKIVLGLLLFWYWTVRRLVNETFRDSLYSIFCGWKYVLWILIFGLIVRQLEHTGIFLLHYKPRFCWGQHKS